MASRPFVAEIAQAHAWLKCLPTDLVVETGQLVEELVFVIQGRILMQCVDGIEGFDEQVDAHKQDVSTCGSHMIEERELAPGAWFGEKCLFKGEHVRIATGIAAMESELAVLHASDYHRIIQKYPPVLMQHNKLQAAIGANKVNFSHLAYKRKSAQNLGGRGTVFNVMMHRFQGRR